MLPGEAREARLGCGQWRGVCSQRPQRAPVGRGTHPAARPHGPCRFLLLAAKGWVRGRHYGEDAL